MKAANGENWGHSVLHWHPSADLWKGVLSVSGRKQVVCGSKGKQELNGLKEKENSIKDKKVADMESVHIGSSAV